MKRKKRGSECKYLKSIPENLLANNKIPIVKQQRETAELTSNAQSLTSVAVTGRKKNRGGKNC